MIGNVFNHEILSWPKSVILIVKAISRWWYTGTFRFTRFISTLQDSSTANGCTPLCHFKLFQDFQYFFYCSKSDVFFVVSESCSEMNLTEQEMKFPGEDLNTKCVMPCLDQQEHKQDLQKDQVMISLHNLVIFNLHVFQISFCSALQNPSCLLPSKGQDDFQEASLRNSGISTFATRLLALFIPPS